ncbi:Asp-tRNA(Asn)/Glu-tRNA(Gln) amidotransferase subunit GatB [bacterium (Candidatus Gribaldobacteria) CG10_big_fil_rev_8_21_14_0_10_33_41]|nr:MAG: Asp-tRNA(Asn)/Glu-tRNA(Gln) amidotransferase subunit GatB [bacterium (Candidatus Gribaldobacteria) CG10_big_fil_rev_8_21_14_0_10_33_41]PJB09062.1 MAG: Asp-tRNA(Asn)/Glu-tRNA(Gln) amidotransferase subunit GatB [bacterium (Candidatus Gribaldobacteria) CG_4_9_14_3_um_filter_33_9]
MNYQPTIGLELHIELNTNSKMFCSCKNDSNELQPNANICPICLAHPGTLPVINKEAVKKVIKTALALNCEIQKDSYFERKNYFYPDLPKGYQISQYAAPLAKNGYLEIKDRKIKIRRIHLEEDTGKLIHPEATDYSLIDFNRAGIPLMELVTEPDISSGNEAQEFAEELQLILKYLGVSEANMEKGEMRVEVNISLYSDKKLGTKVEIKNLNSLRAVEKAIDYEIERQKEILEKGEKIVQETRGWDEKKGITLVQREKEEAYDYRYFPEPDLPPLQITKEFLEEIRSEIPELPGQRRERFKKEYGLKDSETELYVSQKDLGEYFEKVISELREWIKAKRFKREIPQSEFQRLIKLTSNYISSDLLGLLKETSQIINKCLITPENFAEFISMIYLKEASSKIAKILLKEMFETGTDPSQIIERRGLEQITDEKKLEEIIKTVIAKNPQPVADYKKGKEGALQFLVGQIMAETKGKANPEIAKKILKKFL